MKEELPFNLLFNVVVLIHTILMLIFSDVLQTFELALFPIVFILAYIFLSIIALVFTPLTIIEIFILEKIYLLFIVIYNQLIKKKKIT